MKLFFSRYRFYILTAIVFIVWQGFLANSSIKNQIILWKQCKEYENNIEHFKQELETVKKDKARLFGSVEAMETFAREKYLMKKKDELVFVLVDEEGNLLEE